jgi:DHA1 family bicyclomycin/chloramphenicol resistance-like MFS transporter
MVMARKPGPIFALALASISLIGPLCVHIFLPVLPALKGSLGVSEAVAQATFSIALFGMSIATLVYGTLSDRLGRRPVLLSGLALFLLGSALSLVAPGIEVLIVARLLQAVGAACGVTLVRSIARDAYGPDKLVQALAYLTMFYTLGPMIAPIAGGILVDTLGWRSVFGFALAGGLLITFGAWFVVYETQPPQSGQVHGSILSGYASLFSHMRFCAFVFQTGFSTGAFMVSATTASYLMKDTLDRSATDFGLWFLAFPFGFFSGNFVSSRIANRVTIETMVLMGSSLSFASVAAEAVLLGSGYVTPAAIFLPGFFLTFSQGISMPYAQAGAMAINPRLAGTAAGVGVCLQNLLGAITTQAYGFIADGTVTPIAITAGASGFMTMVCGAIPYIAKLRTAR